MLSSAHRGRSMGWLRQRLPASCRYRGALSCRLSNAPAMNPRQSLPRFRGPPRRHHCLGRPRLTAARLHSLTAVCPATQDMLVFDRAGLTRAAGVCEPYSSHCAQQCELGKAHRGIPRTDMDSCGPCCAQEMTPGPRVLNDCQNYVLYLWWWRKQYAILNWKGVQHGRAAAISSGTKLHGAGASALTTVATTSLYCAPLAFEAGTAGCCRGNRLTLFPSKELEKATTEPTRNVSSDHACTTSSVLQYCAFVRDPRLILQESDPSHSIHTTWDYVKQGLLRALYAASAASQFLIPPQLHTLV